MTNMMYGKTIHNLMKNKPTYKSPPLCHQRQLCVRQDDIQAHHTICVALYICFKKNLLLGSQLTSGVIMTFMQSLSSSDHSWLSKWCHLCFQNIS